MILDTGKFELIKTIIEELKDMGVTEFQCAEFSVSLSGHRKASTGWEMTDQIDDTLTLDKELFGR